MSTADASGGDKARRIVQPRLSVILLVVCMGWSAFCTAYFPEMFVPANFDGFPAPLRLVVKPLLFISNWPWDLVLFIVFVAWYALARFTSRAPVLAAIVGSAIGHIAVEIIRSMQSLGI